MEGSFAENKGQSSVTVHSRSRSLVSFVYYYGPGQTVNVCHVLSLPVAAVAAHLAVVDAVFVESNGGTGEDGLPDPRQPRRGREAR